MPPPSGSWGGDGQTHGREARRRCFAGLLFFCKSWCRLGVLEPSQRNEGGKAGEQRGGRGKEGSEGSVFQTGRGCLRFSPRLPGQRLAAPNPPPPPPPLNVHHALGTWVWVAGGAARSTEAGRLGLQQPGSSESSERSHRMIKGKWRIDLGGKIKGAKSVALGSAVTKRGQDNSLQMCERCKYQAGGGAAARRAGGAQGQGLGGPREARGPLGDGPVRLAPLQGADTGGGKRRVGEPQVPSGGFVSGASLGGPGAALQGPFPPAGGPEVEGSNQLPSPPLRTPPRPSAQAWPPPAGPTRQRPLPRPPPRRPCSRPSLARGAAAAPSAVEASGAAVCGGHFAEEPGAEGMQMRQTQGGERRSPREAGGRAPGAVMDACPAGEGRGAPGRARRWARPAGCGSLGRAGGIWAPGYLCGEGQGAVGTAGPGVTHTLPPTAVARATATATSRSWLLNSRRPEGVGVGTGVRGVLQGVSNTPHA